MNNNKLNSNPVEITSNTFREIVNEICIEKDIEQIIETGTCIGTGSTKIFADTDLDIVTLECNPINAARAKENLKNYKNVTIINGLSLSKKDMIEFLMNDIEKHPDNIMVDSKDPVSFYINEINFNVEEDLLFDLINNDKKQIVFLDSAGGVGYLEYLQFMLLTKEFKANKVLMLDDTRHVKHYRSVEDLKDKSKELHEYDRFCYATF